MDRVYEDLERILENRRIRSEVIQKEKVQYLMKRFPQLQEIENEISKMTTQSLLQSLEGETDNDLLPKLERLELQRQEVLKECGLTEADLQRTPTCSICNDTGYVNKKGRDGKTQYTFCDCTRTLLAPVMLARSGVEKYMDFSFEKGDAAFFTENPSLKNKYEKLQILAKQCRVPNMVFYGASGRGKTFLAVAIAREYAMQGHASLVIRQADFAELMQEHRKVIGSYFTPSQKEQDIEARKNYLIEADLLVLDDLGVEAKTPNTQADLLYILDERSLAGKTTIITTNYDMDALRERYGGRVFERIDHDYRRFCFSSSSKKENV
ncbi:MAG: ATP-binding protein [Clostridiales bacterium]|nr:ATP-binding protein [Candidatus Scatonaster coprocaballi]